MRGARRSDAHVLGWQQCAARALLPHATLPAAAARTAAKCLGSLCPAPPSRPRPPLVGPCCSRRGGGDPERLADPQRDARPAQNCPPLPGLGHPAQYLVGRAQRLAVPQVRARSCCLPADWAAAQARAPTAHLLLAVQLGRMVGWQGLLGPVRRSCSPASAATLCAPAQRSLRSPARACARPLQPAGGCAARRF